MEPEVWPWNVGVGTPDQRKTALIYCAIEHPNVVTRHVCREILANQLNRALNAHSATPQHTVTEGKP